MLQISYKEGLAGNNVLILRENDVKIITDLMMGGPGNVDPDEPLTELHLSAIGEAMNQMMGSAATSLSSMFNRKIDISPPIANLVETYNELDDNLPGFLKNHFVMVAFKMQIGELIDSEIMQLYPKEFAQELLNMFMPSAEPEQPQVSQEDTANHQEEQLQQADRSAGFAEVRKGESDARGGPLCGFLYSEIDGRFPLQGRRKMPQSVM